MNPSKFQQGIYDFIEDPLNGSAQVEAVAGSGKTTTILHAASLLPDSHTKIFLAFNKAIANELRDKLPPDVQASTFNSLGFKIYRREFSCAMNANKTRDLMLKRGYKVADQVTWDTIRAIGALKAAVIEPGDPEFDLAVDHIQNTHDLELPESPSTFLENLLQESNRMLDEIDFNDQLYLPIIYDMHFPTFDEIFVDESQDLSQVQIEMLTRMMNHNSRIFCVGDSRQAIYAFRGANAEAIKELQERFSLTQLPLSISYRCPKQVIKEAQFIVPQIEAWEQAEEGLVTHQEGKPTLQDLAPGTLTLCRFNAPLFSLGLQLVINQKPCALQTNMVQSMMGLIYSLGGKNTDVIMSQMEDFYQQEREKYLEKGHMNRLKILEEKRDCLMVLCKNTPDKKVSTLLGLLKKLKDSRVGPVLSTIHKAKGTEANHVFYLRHYGKEEFIKSKTSHPIQEDNLVYVGITRAKRTLTYYDLEQEEQ